VLGGYSSRLPWCRNVFSLRVSLRLIQTSEGRESVLPRDVAPALPVAVPTQKNGFSFYAGHFDSVPSSDPFQFAGAGSTYNRDICFFDVENDFRTVAALHEEMQLIASSSLRFAKDRDKLGRDGFLRGDHSGSPEEQRI
jgi:hypothetical protein